LIPGAINNECVAFSIIEIEKLCKENTECKRNYDPLLCRFTQVDPLCEKYYGISQYSYCLNNPVRLIDVKGQDPWDYFDTKIQAARDFGNYYNPSSIKYNIEQASFILYNPQNRKYYYPEAVKGNNNTSNKVIAISKTHKLIASIHTHGAFDKEYINSWGDWNDNFSGLEDSPEKNLKHIPQKDFDDIYSANRRGIESFLVTPNGNLKVYDPKTGKVKIVSKDMPSDKHAGKYRVNNNIVDTRHFIQKFFDSLSSLFH